MIGQVWQGIRVDDIADAARILPAAECNIGVLAVPAEAAQESAERLAALGIRAILNFAPALLHLQVPKNVPPIIVRNIDLAGEMSILTHRLTVGPFEDEE